MKTKDILNHQIKLLSIVAEDTDSEIDKLVIESVIKTLKGLEPEEPIFQTARIALENFEIGAHAICDIAKQQGAPIKMLTVTHKINGTKEIEIRALPGYDSKLTHFIQNDTLCIKWRTN